MEQNISPVQSPNEIQEILLSQDEKMLYLGQKVSNYLSQLFTQKNLVFFQYFQELTDLILKQSNEIKNYDSIPYFFKKSSPETKESLWKICTYITGLYAFQKAYQAGINLTTPIENYTPYVISNFLKILQSNKLDLRKMAKIVRNSMTEQFNSLLTDHTNFQKILLTSTEQLYHSLEISPQTLYSLKKQPIHKFYLLPEQIPIKNYHEAKVFPTESLINTMLVKYWQKFSFQHWETTINIENMTIPLRYYQSINRLQSTRKTIQEIYTNLDHTIKQYKKNHIPCLEVKENKAGDRLETSIVYRETYDKPTNIEDAILQTLINSLNWNITDQEKLFDQNKILRFLDMQDETIQENKQFLIFGYEETDEWKKDFEKNNPENLLHKFELNIKQTLSRTPSNKVNSLSSIEENFIPVKSFKEKNWETIIYTWTTGTSYWLPTKVIYNTKDWATRIILYKRYGNQCIPEAELRVEKDIHNQTITFEDEPTCVSQLKNKWKKALLSMDNSNRGSKKEHFLKRLFWDKFETIQEKHLDVLLDYAFVSYSRLLSRLEQSTTPAAKAFHISKTFYNPEITNHTSNKDIISVKKDEFQLKKEIPLIDTSKNYLPIDAEACYLGFNNSHSFNKPNLEDIKNLPYVDAFIGAFFDEKRNILHNKSNSLLKNETIEQDKILSDYNWVFSVLELNNQITYTNPSTDWRVATYYNFLLNCEDSTKEDHVQKMLSSMFENIVWKAENLEREVLKKNVESLKTSLRNKLSNIKYDFKYINTKNEEGKKMSVEIFENTIKEVELLDVETDKINNILEKQRNIMSNLTQDLKAAWYDWKLWKLWWDYQKHLEANLLDNIFCYILQENNLENINKLLDLSNDITQTIKDLLSKTIHQYIEITLINNNKLSLNEDTLKSLWNLLIEKWACTTKFEDEMKSHKEEAIMQIKNKVENGIINNIKKTFWQYIYGDIKNTREYSNFIYNLPDEILKDIGKRLIEIKYSIKSKSLTNKLIDEKVEKIWETLKIKKIVNNDIESELKTLENNFQSKMDLLTAKTKREKISNKVDEEKTTNISFTHIENDITLFESLISYDWTAEKEAILKELLVSKYHKSKKEPKRNKSLIKFTQQLTFLNNLSSVKDLKDSEWDNADLVQEIRWENKLDKYLSNLKYNYLLYDELQSIINNKKLLNLYLHECYNVFQTFPDELYKILYHVGYVDAVFPELQSWEEWQPTNETKEFDREFPRAREIVTKRLKKYSQEKYTKKIHEFIEKLEKECFW